MAFTKDGNYFLARSKDITELWDAQTWKYIVTIPEDGAIVTSNKRYCIGLIHQQTYKPLNEKLISELIQASSKNEVGKIYRFKEQAYGYFSNRDLEQTLDEEEDDDENKL